MKLIAKNGITVPKSYLTDKKYKQIKKDLVVINPAYLACVNFGKRPVTKLPSGQYITIPKTLNFMKEYGNRLELPGGYCKRLSEIFGSDIEIEYLPCESINHILSAEDLGIRKTHSHRKTPARICKS